ncbi:transketolase [Paenibacillus psychroresistens]|uniref:Transketolase n=1 Tax=Paenibacillus psychroresistens TaxID=1778678 RepID=A0A6B8RQF8_9BACL|nr:transketolase [Paenibacillus psychroresistens]QGQ98229.1 transketolase [Paenibacillus psychroresistens]
MTVINKSIEQLAIDTIRTLSIDAIDKAKSGHPGMPMGSAPMAYELWSQFMNHSPANPKWINRDRFVLSAGHGSMLLYSMLHLSGYDLPLEELKKFRQWGSLTPGHPEYHWTAGVDATTGPLGQGIGMAVGMAIAEAHLGATYNQANYSVIDHFTYAICGDGDLMEGISSEAASLAGHLKLGKLVLLYDSNNISLDGDLDMSFSENIQTRFEGYQWHVQKVLDGNNLQEIHAAIAAAQADPRPSLIEVKTTIGYGSPNKGGKGGEHGSHGSPLGPDETILTKAFYGWSAEYPAFYIPEEVKAHFAELKAKGIAKEQAWQEQLAQYIKAYPELGKQFEQAVAGELPEGWDADLPVYSPDDKPLASRIASEKALNGIAKNFPFLMGGSADLETSTKTNIAVSTRLTPENYGGRNVFFGVREFAMAAAGNGLMLHGGLRPFVSTFFVFSDYMKPAIRLASIMSLPLIYVFTHDSIGVGEDGPTHEPIEQLAALRIIPHMTVIRPADGNETSQAWRYAVEQKEGPVALIFTRQNLTNLEGTAELAKENLARGAYVLVDAPDGKPQVQLLASGSEVGLAVDAQKKLAEEGINARVISMPSWELFEKQPKSYRDSVILPEVKARLGIEMAVSFGWDRYVGEQGDVLAIDRFGASAPAPTVIREYGFTVENVVAKVKALLQ